MDAGTVFLLVLLMGGVGALIGARKGQPFGGFLLGFLLGPIGWLIAAVAGDGPRRKCPFCAEFVSKEALVCKHCGRNMPALAGRR